jgi:hypothetical protein
MGFYLPYFKNEQNSSAGEIENRTFKIIFYVFSGMILSICLSSNMPSK